MKVRSAHSVQGIVRLPGDKSISHRAAMLASIATGETRIENFATSADCASTVACMQSLGVDIIHDDVMVRVRGVGKNGLRRPSAALNCGNSGTTMRLLAGILAGQRFESELFGDESLNLRPMKRIIVPLTMMGADINGSDGYPPLRINATGALNAIEYFPEVASAQIKSCIMLAGLYADGVSSVTEKTSTRDHTERMLRWFGVDVGEIETFPGKSVQISGDAILTAHDLQIPSDISSAAFFITAAACLIGSDITLSGIGLNGSRTAVLDVLSRFGADIGIDGLREESNEPVGDIHVIGGGWLSSQGRQNVLDGKIIANLIDEVPILAVAGTQINGGLEIRDAGELRVKESDRIAAIVENLRRMNAIVEEFPDGFRVERSQLIGAPVDSFGDHRIAMAFAIAGLFAAGETEILGPEAVDVSFPGFFETLESIVIR
ncbi:MAG: 3-phosphoshikimate 1-carboxyvinyltransferase [Pyrinomonadaceae bacterium]